MKHPLRILSALLLLMLLIPLSASLVACGEEYVAETPEKAKKALEKNGYTVRIEENVDNGKQIFTRVIAFKSGSQIFLCYFASETDAQAFYHDYREANGTGPYINEGLGGIKMQLGIRDNYLWLGTAGAVKAASD